LVGGESRGVGITKTFLALKGGKDDEKKGKEE
jgi:hypothetical protein